MFRIFSIYRDLFEKKWIFYFIASISMIILILCSYNVRKINTDIQDSILNIVSILFPLIAGFLTFGREIMKELDERIHATKTIDSRQEGRPTPDIQKRNIVKLKKLTSNFKGIVISTFIVSFCLIIFVLVAKFNSFFFQTHSIRLEDFDFLEYVFKNGASHFVKLLFFFMLLILFMNLSFVVYFIFKVNQDDSDETKIK